MFPADEIGNQVHGAWPIEGQDGDEVFEGVGPKARQEIAHAGAFQLKQPHGFPGAQEGKGCWIIKRDMIDREGGCLRMRLMD